MARKRKEGLIEVVAGATALLPWWGGVLLAMVSYFVLHSVAERPSATSLQPGQLGIFAVAALWQTLATIGQYLLPVLFFFAPACRPSSDTNLHNSVPTHLRDQTLWPK